MEGKYEESVNKIKSHGLVYEIENFEDSLFFASIKSLSGRVYASCDKLNINECNSWLIEKVEKVISWTTP